MKFKAFLNNIKALTKLYWISFSSNIPWNLRKYIVLLDHVSNNNCSCFDNINLYKALLRTKFRNNTFYLVDKKQFNLLKDSFTDEEKKHCIVLKNWFSFKLFLILPRIKFWIDSYQDFPYLGLQNYLLNFKGISIYSQHGINCFKTAGLENTYISNLFFNNIVVTSSQEANLIKTKFAYQNNNILKFGLLRWDALSKANSVSSNVFIYFTFRDYFKRYGCDDFYATVKKLSLAIQQLGFNVYVGLHHETHLKSQNFPKNTHIVCDSDISKAKDFCSILITDYSSMCFDFSAVNKKTIFFFPDLDQANHFTTEDKLNIKNALDLLSSHPVAKSISDVKYFLTSILKNNSYKSFSDKYISSCVSKDKTVSRRYIDYISSAKQPHSDRKKLNTILIPPLSIIKETLIYDFDSEFPGYIYGFSNIENKFRWAICNICGVVLSLNKGNWDISFELRSFEPKKKIKVFINDDFFSEVVCSQKLEPFHFKTQTKNDSNLIHFSFITRNNLSPRDKGINNDYRELAFALHKCTVSRV